MYTAFYGLREKPFSLTPDPRFLFLATSHREALAHILYGIDQGEGFICITGEVGTGKTTLCRTLLRRLDRDTEVAFVFNPTLSGVEMLRAISVELGLDVAGRTRAELSERLNAFLLETNRAGRRVLLIIDEAQNLSNETLEEIRLFSNLETPTSKLIQILLFGQPELDEKLEKHELRQLRQRISVRWSLGTLSSSETRDYVVHRLTIAAGYQSEFFTEAALREVYRKTGGVPRLINVLCNRSLLAGFADGSRQIEAQHVRKVAREIGGHMNHRSRRWISALAVAAACIALLGIVAWQLRNDESVATAWPAVSTAPPMVAGPPESKDLPPFGGARLFSEEAFSQENSASITTFVVGGDDPR